MYTLLICASLLLHFQTVAVTAHYLFAHLLVNGTLTGEFQYVRNVTGNDTKGDPKFEMAVPQSHNELSTTNFSCGREAFRSARTTETATVIAGSEVGFRIANIPYVNENVGESWKGKIFHDGPANIYMAKAPTDTLSSFKGDDADWFRIAEFSKKDDSNWLIGPYAQHTWKSDVNFTIPSTTPPGAYLLRLEQFPFTPYLQFYVNCAHINVVGPGGGTPTAFARFPGTYNYTAIRNYATSKGIKGFDGLGPQLWKG